MNEKIYQTEALLDIMSEIFEISTNEAAKRMLAVDIHSFDDFKERIEARSSVFKLADELE